MNRLFIKCHTVVPNSRGYSPPVGLIVYDVPLFTLLLCNRLEYYNPKVIGPRPYWPTLSDCTVWALEGSGRFRQDGSMTCKDQTFRIELDMGWANYATTRLSLDDVLQSSPYQQSTTYFSGTVPDPKFLTSARLYMLRNRIALKSWLAERIVNVS